MAIDETTVFLVQEWCLDDIQAVADNPPTNFTLEDWSDIAEEVKDSLNERLSQEGLIILRDLVNEALQKYTEEKDVTDDKIHQIREQEVTEVK